MNAKTARKEYFEEYIVFEHQLRDFYSTFTTRPKDKTKMSMIIMNLEKINSKHELNLPVDKIKLHIKLRNRLAHSKADFEIPVKEAQLMKNIKKFNDSLAKRFKK